MPTVRLTWQEGAPEQAGDGFRIYRSVNGGAFSLLQTLPITATQYDDTDVSWGNFYQYRVCEYRSDSESPYATGAAIFKSDVGGGIEAIGYRAIAQSDSGLGADTISYRSFNLVDIGTVQEASALLLTRLETATGLESTPVLSATLVHQDAGQGEDWTGFRLFILSEAPSEAIDALSLSAALVCLDEGSGAEATVRRALETNQEAAAAENVVYRLFGQSDSGLGADAIQWVQLYRLGADLGSAVDTIVWRALETNQEAAAAENVVYRLFGQSDSGLSAEALYLVATLSCLEQATGTDAGALEAYLVKLDVGASTEASAIATVLAGTDSGLSAEALYLVATLSCLEQATGTDAGALEAYLVKLDVGASTEASAIATALLSCLEQATGTDAGALEAYLVKLDVGTSTEASAIATALAGTDGGLGTDAIQWVQLYRLGADLGSAVDTIAWRTIAANQVGGGIESAEGGSLYDIFDLALGQDRHLYLFVRSPGSPWGWKIYRVDPADTTKVLQPPSASTGERYAPAKKKLAAPGVTSSPR